jgi:DNA-binding CsgD family transcriptional regulator
METAENNTPSLVVFERGAQLLAEANTIQKARELKALALTAAEYARQMKMSAQAILSAKGYALEAERKMGQMLKESAERGERAMHVGRKKMSSPEEPISEPTLADIGVTKKESHHAQQLADMPNAAFADLKNGKVTRSAATRPDARRSNKPAKEHDRQPEVAVLYDQGKTGNEIARTLNLSRSQVANILKSERTKRAAQVNIEPSSLSLTAQRKLELAIKQHKEKLTAQWQVAVRARVDELLLNSIGPRLQREQNEARYVMKSRKGIMDRDAYKKILACLHPDRINQFITDPKLRQTYDEAWHFFRAVEKLLLNEKNSPTEFVAIPKTSEEWDALKRQTRDARKARRADLSRIRGA